MGISGKGMEDQDGIGPLVIQLAIGLIGNGNWAKLFAALQHQFMGWMGEIKILCLNYTHTAGIVSSLKVALEFRVSFSSERMLSLKPTLTLRKRFVELSSFGLTLSCRLLQGLVNIFLDILYIL